jgi:hypothetical protein
MVTFESGTFVQPDNGAKSMWAFGSGRNGKLGPSRTSSV